MGNDKRRARVGVRVGAREGARVGLGKMVSVRGGVGQGQG